MKLFRNIAISFIFIGLFLVPNFSFGATLESVKAKISDTTNQINKLNDEIARLKTEISKTSDQSRTLANLIQELTLTRDKLVKERTVTEKQITSTGLIISSLSKDITTKEESITNNDQTISKLIYDIYKGDQRTFIENILSTENISDVSKEYNNIVSLNEKLRVAVISLTNEKNNLVVSKNQKTEEENSLKDLKNKLVEQQQAVEASKLEKNKILTETKNQEANYKKLLTEQLKKKDAFEKSLQDYESQLKFILDAKVLPKQGTGVLSWPLDSIYITSPWGSRWGSFHYGVDLKASIGTPVKAMSSGTVEGTGDTDISCRGVSYGRWVFIKYDNGLSSTFGHLSVIKASVGQKVSTGDVVALSGNTGYSTGPHLHVSVYASGGVKVATIPSKSCNGKILTQPISALNAYLNPVLYLP